MARKCPRCEKKTGKWTGKKRESRYGWTGKEYKIFKCKNCGHGWLE